MKNLNAKYVKSVVDNDEIINDGKPQFAFVGRSNVGKSSLINALVNQKKLAKTSSTPGLTKMINYFLINDKFYFVDLPGYGFAKTSQKDKKNWAEIIEKYFTNSIDLVTVFVLMDIRHDLSLNDLIMIDYLLNQKINFKIIATKADKISKSQLNNNLKNWSTKLNIRKESIISVSSISKQGIELLLNYIYSTVEACE